MQLQQQQLQTSLLSGPMQTHCIRIGPGESLISALQDAAKKSMSRTPNSASAIVLSTNGSIKDVTLCLARALGNSNGNERRRYKDQFQVRSLGGTISIEGEHHLNLSMSKADGTSIGGKLVDAIVDSSHELLVVLGTISNVSFSRELDSITGHKELVVRPMSAPSPTESQVVHGRQAVAVNGVHHWPKLLVSWSRQARLRADVGCIPSFSGEFTLSNTCAALKLWRLDRMGRVQVRAPEKQMGETEPCVMCSRPTELLCQKCGVYLCDDPVGKCTDYWHRVEQVKKKVEQVGGLTEGGQDANAKGMSFDASRKYE